VVGEELPDREGQRADVPRRHHPPRGEPPHRLGDAADVVRDGRHARAQRAQERAALVELGPVRKDGDGRVAEGAVDLRRREITEPPLDLEPVGRGAIGLDRLERIPGDEQPRALGPPHGLDRVAESLIRPDHPEGEDGPTVVVAAGLAREDGVGDDAQPLAGDAEPGERFPAVLAVHHDAVEAAEEPPPELRPVRGAAREQVMRGEDRRQVRPEEQSVELGRRKPLDVQDVRLDAAERAEPERMLRDLEREPQARASEQARRERVEELPPPVALRGRDVPEPETRGHELDLGTGSGERGRKLVVVRRGEGRGIGEDDAHALVGYSCGAAHRGGWGVTFEEARAQFPVLRRLAYLNAGTSGPLPRSATEAMRERLERDLERGRSGTAYFEGHFEQRERIRAAFADLLGTTAEHVALTDSTTRGCQIVLAGLGLRPDDEVVTTGEEHFGLLGPLHASGGRVVVAEADEDAVLAAVTPRTRLVAVSHVLWTTGRRLDLARLGGPSGPPLLVDGAQSAGAIPVDLAGADFYTVSAQKWLCAPEPTGALFVRDPERLRVALPGHLARTSHERDGSFVPKPGARRFDSGWIGGPTLAGLEAALACHPDWRYEAAAAAAMRCRELLEPLVEVVTPPGHSTLVSFRPPGDPTELVTSLAERDVIVRELPGRNLVRVSCGWWTSDDDLERLRAGVAAG
jgi:L-cysteine/cystine lyase